MLTELLQFQRHFSLSSIWMVNSKHVCTNNYKYIKALSKWCLQVKCHNHPTPPGQNGRNFVEIFKCIFMNDRLCIFIWISLKFVLNCPIGNRSGLVRYWLGTKLLALCLEIGTSCSHIPSCIMTNPSRKGQYPTKITHYHINSTVYIGLFSSAVSFFPKSPICSNKISALLDSSVSSITRLGLKTAFVRINQNKRDAVPEKRCNKRRRTSLKIYVSHRYPSFSKPLWCLLALLDLKYICDLINFAISWKPQATKIHIKDDHLHPSHAHFTHLGCGCI